MGAGALGAGPVSMKAVAMVDDEWFPVLGPGPVGEVRTTLAWWRTSSVARRALQDDELRLDLIGAAGDEQLLVLVRGTQAVEDPDLIEVQPVWQQAADRVVADVRASLALTIRIRVAIRDHGPDLTWAWAGTALEGRAATAWTHMFADRKDRLWLESNLGCEELIYPYQGLEVATEHVASWVQDNVIEHEQVTWPRCPEHFHPLYPTATPADAFWLCERDPGVRIPIGSYLPPYGGG